ncbi:MAG: sporulation protein YqfD [Lachnospiraceae bacterium]
MKNGMKYLRGYVAVTLRGKQPERFLNLCSYNNITVWDLQCCDGQYKGKLLLSEYKKIRPLVKKTKMKIRIIGRFGLPFKIQEFRGRKLFPIGIGICLGILYMLSLSIWDIEVNGNSYRTDTAIIKFLQEKNLSVGTSKKNINCEKIEDLLRTQYKDIIWASAKITGTKLIIDVQENLVTNRCEKKLEGAYNIVADSDGVIYSIVTRRGVPQVREGSKVKKGDLLVDGCIPLYNDNQELIDYDYCAASADIIAYGEYPYKESMKKDQAYPSFTGETKARYYFIFGTLEWKLPHLKHKFKKWDRITEEKNVRIGKDFFLPIRWRKETIREFVIKHHNYKNSEVRFILENNVERYCEKLKEKGIQIVEKNVMIRERKNRVDALGTIKVREYIGIYKKAEEKNNDKKEGQLENEFNGN